MIDYRALKELSLKNSNIEASKDGLFTLKIKGQNIHSAYSPAKEAQRLVEPVIGLDQSKTLVIVIGCGLGYHIEILEREGFENMLIIEQNPEIFSIFQKIYKLNSSQLMIGPSDSPDKLDSIFSMLEIQNVKNIKTIILRGNYSKEVYQGFEDRIERLLKVKLGDFSTRLKFEENWFINIIRNIPGLKKSIPASSLLYRNCRLPVLVISAGPSLRNSLEGIRKIQDYCVTIAVDTAVLPLYEAGIVPDFIYSLDSQVHNLSDFSFIDPDYIGKTRLVYDIVVNSAVPDHFNRCREKSGKLPGNIITNTAHLDFDYSGNSFMIKNELVNWMEVAGGFAIGDVETGGSVATSAFHFAFLLGGYPVVLTGQDLAYSYKISHSPSTSHYYRISQMTNRLKPIESVFMKILHSRKYISTDSLSSGEIITDFVLNNFRGWFEESSRNILRAHPDYPLLNATEFGARIDNFQRFTLTDLAKKMVQSGKKIDKKKLFDVQLIDSMKVDKIMSGIFHLGRFVRKMNVDESIFAEIDKSDWSFLKRYFMREKSLLDRYGNFDRTQIDRKIYRLIKNIEGISNVDKEA